MSANNQSAQGSDNHINLYEPHVWKHHTKVAGLEWKNPVGTASGTFQYAAVRWFYDVSQLGSVCTKGASPVPWEGNPSPRTAESPAANINAVGPAEPRHRPLLGRRPAQAQGRGRVRHLQCRRTLR